MDIAWYLKRLGYDISSLLETFVFPKIIKDLYPVLLFVKLVLELKQPNSVQIV